jgi:hypothetical protein
MPAVNDLVRVSFVDLDDPDEGRRAGDLPSRIEDVTLDVRSGRVTDYVIAAPWFPGDLEEPHQGRDCTLEWVTPRGRYTLLCALQAQELTSYGLRVWRVRVTGEPRREERRRFVRVPWVLPIELAVSGGLDALVPPPGERAVRDGVATQVADLPERMVAQAVDLGEGGIRCLGPERALPGGVPVVVTFALDGTRFEVEASVVRSRVDDRSANDRAEPERAVHTALVFDDPGRLGDRLRPLLFAAQLRARREGVI